MKAADDFFSTLAASGIVDRGTVIILEMTPYLQ